MKSQMMGSEINAQMFVDKLASMDFSTDFQDLLLNMCKMGRQWGIPPAELIKIARSVGEFQGILTWARQLSSKK